MALAVVVAGVRAGYILYERHEDYVAAQKQEQARKAGYSNADYYVVPKKLQIEMEGADQTLVIEQRERLTRVLRFGQPKGEQQ